MMARIHPDARAWQRSGSAPHVVGRGFVLDSRREERTEGESEVQTGPVSQRDDGLRERNEHDVEHG